MMGETVELQTMSLQLFIYFWHCRPWKRLPVETMDFQAIEIRCKRTVEISGTECVVVMKQMVNGTKRLYMSKEQALWWTSFIKCLKQQSLDSDAGVIGRRRRKSYSVTKFTRRRQEQAPFPRFIWPNAEKGVACDSKLDS
jgi:hypothetical protein